MHNASTYIVQHTHVTVRCGSGSTYGASMINQPVAEVIALLGWDDFPKLHLHFFRVLYSIYEPIRLQRRMQCVSVTMAGLPYTSPIIRLALFLPTPGSFSRSVILSGTRLPKSSRSILMQALISRALLFPRPHGRTISSMSETSASARASMEGYFFEQIHHDYIYAGISALGCEPD